MGKEWDERPGTREMVDHFPGLISRLPLIFPFPFSRPISVHFSSAV